jgi:phage protein U
MSLLTWGDYSFDAGATSFEELTHKWGGRWARQFVFGRRPPGQYLAPEEELLSIEGTIYPVGGIGNHQQLLAMQREAGAGTVDLLFTGDGSVLGLFRLDHLEYRASEFLNEGTAQKVKYTLHFAAADDASGTIYAIWP